MEIETPEEMIVDLEWSKLSEQDRAELIARQATYIETSRRFVHALAVHGTDIRTLIFNMLIVLVLSMFGAETRTTILVMLGVQLFFTAMSKLLSLGVLKQLEDLRKSYVQFLREKRN